MTRPVSVTERVGQWQQAFSMIREELTPNQMRTILATMEQADGVAQLQSYMVLARNVMANDRSAALVAAMLVTTGIRPIPTDFGEE